MSDTWAPTTNIVRFRRPHAPSARPVDQHRFLDAVYDAGSLPVAADDRSTKVLATRLTIFGFVTIDEVQCDGSVRRLRPSEAVRAPAARPWRVSKPSHRAAGRLHAMASDHP
ncbi:MAG TPA: hypothetical protein VHL98_19550 [Microvirga sp.]|jgi:hypothetical protein|nr:hypothetical protein [Microvirga sp.]